MRTRERATLALGALALGVAVLGVGGAIRSVQLALGLVLLAALAVQVTSRRGLPMSPLLAVLGAALALTALQLVPLPTGLASALDGPGQELRAEGLALLDHAESFAPLSRDPSSTRHGLALLVLLTVAAYLALRIAASERGRAALVMAVVLVGMSALAVTAAHEALGARSLYGVYEPRLATPTLLGPLLNPNHLGCLFALTAAAALGLALDGARRSSGRAAWALCAALAAAATLFTQSRGAAIALLAGGAVCAGTALGQRLRGREQRQAAPKLTLDSVAIGVVALCALALLVYTSGAGVSEQLRDTSADEWHSPRSKYAAWRSAMELVAESPWLGVGRGAFEATFARVHGASGRVTFSHPENEYVQAVVEWGIAGGLVLAVLVGWLALTAARRWRTGALAAAALGGCVVVAVQSVVDFGLELPGLALPTIALLATLVHVPLRESNKRARPGAVVARGAACVGALVATAALATSATELVREAHTELLATRPASVELATTLARRHPHDYLAFAHLGEAHREKGAELPFYNHALRLHPNHPGLHRVVARALLARGAARQAALEYAFALRHSAEVAPLLGEIVRAFSDPELAALAIPTDYPAPEHLARVLVQEKAQRVALRYLQRVAQEHPSAPRVGELLYNAALGAGDLELAESAARLRHRTAPSAASLLALGRLLVQRDKLEAAAAALAELDRQAGKPEELAAVRLLACDVHIARQDWASARVCVEGLADSPYGGKLLLELARRKATIEAGARELPAPKR